MACWFRVSQSKNQSPPSCYCKLQHVTSPRADDGEMLENLQRPPNPVAGVPWEDLDGKTQQLWDTYYIPTGKSSPTHYQILAAGLLISKERPTRCQSFCNGIARRFKWLHQQLPVLINQIRSWENPIFLQQHCRKKLHHNTKQTDLHASSFWTAPLIITILCFCLARQSASVLFIHGPFTARTAVIGAVREESSGGVKRLWMWWGNNRGNDCCICADGKVLEN